MTTPKARLVALQSGVKLHVLDWESPSSCDNLRPWVLTHGLASNARLWDGVASRLLALGHRVVTVDQRGHGQSSKPDEGYEIETCADDLALLIPELGLESPAVAGQSWGGNVVLELGNRHPQIVSQICCVDGGFIDLQAQFPDWETCASTLAPPRLAGTPVDQIRQWIERSAQDWPEEGRAATMANFEIRADNTIAPWLTFDRHMTVLRGLWDHRPFDTFATVQIPTLLIAASAAGDPRRPSRKLAVDRALSLLRTGRAEWFVPAHHDVHAQKPEAVAGLLHAASTQADFYASPASETRS